MKRGQVWERGTVWERWTGEKGEKRSGKETWKRWDDSIRWRGMKGRGCKGRVERVNVERIEVEKLYAKGGEVKEEAGKVSVETKEGV